MGGAKSRELRQEMFPSEGGLKRKIHGSLSFYFRKRRLPFIYDQVLITASTRVLDVGGSFFFWKLAESCGLPVPRLTIVNIEYSTQNLWKDATWVVADGRRLPFASKSFDLAFSNAVIEHLGTWPSQQALASEVRRVAQCYLVQTPG